MKTKRKQNKIFVPILSGLTHDYDVVDWADLATLDLSQFDQPGGKTKLAKQLFEAIQKIGQ
jgi:hypothetical protein